MKSKPKLSHLWPIFAFFIILVIGMSLRTTLLETRDYWYDEAFTGITVRQDWSTMNEIIVNDVHPPLYYWLLKGWTLVGGDGAIALRLFSVLFGVATIVLAFIALRMWFKKSWLPAVLGSFMLAINPFLFNYSQEARMYTLLGFLILLAAVFLMHARQTKHLWAWIAYAITGALILLTHYLGFIFMLSFFLYDAWQQYREHPSFKKWKGHLLWFVKAYGIPFVVGLAWIPFFLKQTATHNTLGWVPNKLFYELPLSLHIFLFGAPVGVTGVPPALGYRLDWLSVSTVTFVLTLALTVLITWLTVKKKWNKISGFLAFMAAFPLLLTWLLQAVQLQLYVERFLSGSAIFFLLFLVATLMSLPKKGWLIGFTGIYTALVIVIQPWSYSPTFQTLTDMTRGSLADNQIVTTSPFDFTITRFYFGEEYRSSLRLYNLNNVRENLADWAIIDKQDQIFELPTADHLIITPQPDSFSKYQTVERVDNFSILE